jgi:hypothetical protein
MKLWGKEEKSRNGPVLAAPEPVILQMWNPLQRVLFDPIRDCNPFFHVMEFIWMMAGQHDVKWIEQFNSNYRQYAEDNGIVFGAYGFRWRFHFGQDQIITAINKLIEDPLDRRVVIGMWDPESDWMPAKDVPCNTHIYLRIVNGALDMTVCNRSNDLIWGMLGANIVHMTMLHEVIALAVGVKLGIYRIFTNNLHVYTNRPDFQKIWNSTPQYDLYNEPENYKWKHFPIIGPENGAIIELMNDCKSVVNWPHQTSRVKSLWMQKVGVPIHEAYLDKTRRKEHIEKIEADDWRLACRQWNERRITSSAT